ncbi:MAG: hypothetical protein RL042_2412 [Nitrospirota bacterium]
MFEQIRSGNARLVLTLTLRDFLDDYDFVNAGNRGLLHQIYRDLKQMFLQTHGSIVVGDVKLAGDYTMHPIPVSASNVGFAEFWSDELGRLLVLHDRKIKGDEFFLGVACDSAFSGGSLGSYAQASGQRAFPLVGPKELTTVLQDAYEWDLPPHCHKIVIGVEDVRRNFRCINGIALDPPDKDSHYKVHFDDGACWTFDHNWGRDIGDNVLKQLKGKGKSKMPLDAIKYCLKEGKVPSRKLRLEFPS